MFARAVSNSEAGLEQMIDQAEGAGRTVMVIDTTSSAARLLLGWPPAGAFRWRMCPVW